MPASISFGRNISGSKLVALKLYNRFQGIGYNERMITFGEEGSMRIWPTLRNFSHSLEVKTAGVPTSIQSKNFSH
jgi:hypothetical protein